MVDPDADKGTVLANNNSVAVQRNIPESCRIHNVERTRSVNISYLIIIIILI